MQTILVTGGAGFIGSNFVRHMLKKYKDYKIIVLDALTYAGNRENLADMENDPRYQFHHGDIRDTKIVEKLMAEVDAVVNFAAGPMWTVPYMKPEHLLIRMYMVPSFCWRRQRNTALNAFCIFPQMKFTVLLKKALLRKMIP